MPYVMRNSAGAVIAAFANPQSEFAEEFLADDHKDVLAFSSISTALDLRARRDVLLALADRIINALEDAGLSSVSVRSYRAALRNVPQQPGFPKSIAWPDFPSGVALSGADRAALAG